LAYWEPLFEHHPYAAGATVITAGKLSRYLWFPTSGLYCQTIETREGSCVDLTVIGREGAVGLPALFGIPAAAQCTVFLGGASALRIDASTLLEHSAQEPSLHEGLMLYSGVRLAEMTQIAACNRIHRLEQRLCRWLLTFCVRAQTSTVPVTHELIALMLGTRRSSVTAEIHALTQRGAVRHARGELVVDNVDALLECVCECYETIEALYRDAYRSRSDL
jgi:CRP-like cAMP-binding protein